ncbi:methyltransferase domain-containing protein [Litorivivens sp.]|uniref:class I SAM-dependent methyltransferase n=1 Tax=Litorivivens sp. TaxID=2020868 RepID=UPI0035693DF4
MSGTKLSAMIKKLRLFPFHPQFLLSYIERHRYKLAVSNACGRILDIGCGDQPVYWVGDNSVEYFGLDYPITGSLYKGNPNVYGSADALPFFSGVFDTVLILEVLEHLAEPLESVREAARVLAEGGVAIVSVPFLYPIHDAPSDFSRWTIYGLEKMFLKSGFDIVEKYSSGNSASTIVVLVNLFLAKSFLDFPVFLKMFFLPLLVVVFTALNLSGLLFHRNAVSVDNNIFPLGYTFILRKSS